MKKSILYECLKRAKAKIPTHPQKDYYIHYSFLVQNNKVLAMGTNNGHKPAPHFGFQTRIFGGCPKTHSEISAWRRGKGLLNFQKEWELVNIRLNKAGKLMLSKPCVCCQEVMSALGCGNFYYSYPQGFLKGV